jgi:serine phosphatase RsbU (regulator of sigma subunit)
MRFTEQTTELKKEYKLEQSEGLHKINRYAAPVTFILILFLMLFTDPVNFPTLAGKMLWGRLYVVALVPIVIIAAFIPKLKNQGYFFSTFGFLVTGLMLAHMTGVLNNETSSVIAWSFASVICCGIYPIPILHTGIVVVASLVYYTVIYFSSGFIADSQFNLVIISVVCASFISLAFKIGVARIREQEFYSRKGLVNANREIADLNEQLQDENLRLAHELEVAQHIQTIVLPQEKEYSGFKDLDIACQMIPAEEVGGDYYDTIYFEQKGIFAIGDVTDHGLHSGLIMMMVHTALRALSQVEKNDIKGMYNIINKLLFDFRLKTGDHRIMTLMILRYLGKGDFVMTGQHESLLILSADGSIKDFSSIEYGMYAGLEQNVDPYLDLFQFSLAKNDVLILYTDGITEAINDKETEFGIEGIKKAAAAAGQGNAEAIKKSILDRCLKHIDGHKIYDDISIMIIKRK